MTIVDANGKPFVRGSITSFLDRTRVPAMPPVRPIRGAMAFLQSEHPVHSTWANWWRWLERCMKGGVFMQQYLRRFEWELDNGDEIEQRRRTATYVNWPEMYASALTGFLTRSAPIPDYGSLGEITALDTPLNRQTRADIFHFNVSGIGTDGAQWMNWWDRRAVNAIGFGHTWIMEEAPPSVARARTGFRNQELAGVRPYLVEWTPPKVWDWHYEDGVLQYAIIRYYTRDPAMRNGNWEAGPSLRYYLHVRKGFDRFGEEWKAGGWWIYDEEGRLVERTNAQGTNVPAQGTYDFLDGDIPLHALFFQRDEGTEQIPAMSRSGVMELASMAESYMNLSSAADFEVWDSAKGIEYFIGVGVNSFNLAMAKIAEGTRYVPVAVEPTAVNPHVQASNISVTPSATFQERLGAKRDDALGLSTIQQNAGPDSSGRAREADFSNTKAPLLASFASEMESAQNTAIPNIQRRWGQIAAGGVLWPRRFELIKVADAVLSVFNAAATVQVKSPTLFGKGMRLIAKDQQVVTDERELDTIEDEITKGMQAQEEAAARLNELKGAGGPPGKKFNIGLPGGRSASVTEDQTSAA